MNKTGIAKALVAAGMAMACAGGLAACGGNGGNTAEGGVAAVVYGTEIAESTVTENIQNMRSVYGMEDDESWASYLSAVGYTPSEYRDMVLDSLMTADLVKYGAEQLGIQVEDSEVDTYVETMRANYVVLKDDGTEDEEATNAAWVTALEGAGFTEESYRDTIKSSLLSQAVYDKLSADAETSDEELLETAKLYASFYDGTRRSSHILFDASDAETAQSVLDQINAGTLSFEDAAKEYSLDGSGADGGDVGWDCVSSFVTEYQDALSALDKGQVSGLVESQFGIHIIKCTDIWNAPEELTSLDQMPQELVDSIRSSASSSAGSTAYQNWLDELRTAGEESGDIVVNPMPEDVPYNVDLSAYTEDATADEAAEGTEGTEGAEGEAVESDAAADDAGDDAAAEEEDAAA